MVGHSIKVFPRDKIDCHNAVSHISGPGFIFDKTTLASDNELLVCRVCDELPFYQTHTILETLGDGRSVDNWLSQLVYLFVHGDYGKRFPLEGKICIQ